MTEEKRLDTLRTHLKGSDSPYLKKVLARQITAEVLREKIRACTECPLHETRTQAVPFDGPTHGKADLVLIGEAPGHAEDKYGRPFIGRSGVILSDALEKAGTKRTRVVIINTLCCRPPKNRDPETSELNACRPLFDRQLAMTKNWVGVALGGYALANVMGVDRSSIRIGDYLDKPVWVDGRVWFGTYHPAYVARNQGAMRELVLSIKAALAVRWGSVPIPWSIANNQETRDSEDLATMKGLDILGGGDALAIKLQKRGWVYARSQALGEQILVVKDEREIYKNSIPKAIRDRANPYTLEEVIKIGEAGAARGGWTREDLRRLHMVKNEFGGEIIA